MKVKEYKFEKTKKGMVSKNKDIHLLSYGDDFLVDLELLNDLALGEDDRQYIVDNIVAMHIPFDTNPVFIINVDKFKSIVVYGKMAKHRVFNVKTCRRRYMICELVAVRVTVKTRRTVWDDLEDEDVLEARNYHGEPAYDIEI